MANSLVPTSVTITVDSVIVSNITQTIGDDTYDRAAIACLSADRDDVHFSQLDSNTEKIVAVNYYGMYLIPYKSTDTLANVEVNLGVTCAGVSVESTMTLAEITTVGTTKEISLNGEGGGT